MRQRGKIGFWGLVALTFFTVSGGAYGIEPVIGSVGAKLGLLLIVLTPLVWSLPTALAVGELNGMMPVAGGYYRWVRYGLGDFWGFVEGWWSWLFTFVDMALYPVLCGDILAQIWPLTTGHALAPAMRLGFILGFIWAAGLINGLGAGWVARYSSFCMALVLAPFLAFLAAAWLRHPAIQAAMPGASPHAGAAAWGLALAAVIWNYTGWDNVGTFAPDVKRPERTYPRALLATLALIAAAYVLPVLAGLRLDPIAAHWTDGYLVRLGAIAWGPWLGLTMALTAVLSAWAQYTSQVLYVLQLPAALAEDRFLPAALGRRDARGIPRAALWFSTVLYSLFALASFGRLLTADLLLYTLGLSLEFVVLLRLRGREPRRSRPFRAPFKGAGLWVMCAAPMLVAATAIYFAAHESPRFIWIGSCMALTAPFWYLACRHQRPAMAATGSAKCETLEIP